MISTNISNAEASEAKVKIEFYLKGDDAKKFIAYQNREKLTTKTQAAYKLIMEGLEQESVSLSA